MPEISDERLAELEASTKRAVDLEASKKRLEDENAKIKSRAKDAEDKLSVSEKAKLEAEGNTTELLNKERAERVELEDKFKKRTTDVLREKLRTEVSKHAKDAHDVDMLLKVTDHKDLLKLDEDSLSVSGVKEYVEKVRESHGYLFSKKQMDGGDNKLPKDANTEFKTDNEKYLSELRACVTRQQMVDVRKKHGKQVD